MAILWTKVCRATDRVSDACMLQDKTVVITGVYIIRDFTTH